MTDKLSTFLRFFANDLKHLTLVRTSSNTGKFQAACMFHGNMQTNGYSVAVSDDPGEAVAQALMSKQMARVFAEKDVVYFHHPESSCVFKQHVTDEDPRHGDPCVEEVSFKTYYELCIEYGQKDEPLFPSRRMVEAPAEPPTHDDVDDFF